MKYLSLLIVMFITLQCARAQSDSLKTIVDTVKIQRPNLIIFVEGYIGRSRGWTMGGNINYQFDHHFFTLRYNYIIKLNTEPNSNPFLFLFPSIKNETEENEWSVLYGYRFINDDYSVSLSLGLSYNYIDYYNRDTDVQIGTQKYLGLPFELNIKGFNALKKRFRIYYIIPVTKPTAFARSLGLKLIGNISKRSYVGFGISYGIGYHKVY